MTDVSAPFGAKMARQVGGVARVVIALSVAVGLMGCSQGPLFVWTLREVVAVSILGLIFAGFVLFVAYIYLLIIIDAVKAKLRQWFAPSRASATAPLQEGNAHQADAGLSDAGAITRPLEEQK